MTAEDAVPGAGHAQDGSHRIAAWAQDYFAATGPRLVYATNVALIAALALSLSFLLNLDRSYWGLLTVALVSQATSGLTVWRSLARIVGTLAGAAFGLMALALFAQNSVAIMGALALWTFCVGALARFEIGLDAYAYSVAGLTALTIILDTGPNADLAYGLALLRTTETLIGIVSAFAVILVVFPVSASRDLVKGIADARNKVMELSRKAAAIGDEIDVGETQAVTKALANTYSNLRAQKLERSHRGVSTRKATEATNRLNDLLIAAERMSFALAGLKAAEPSRQVSDTSARLGDLLNAMPRQAAEATGNGAEAFRAVVSGMDLDPAIRELVERPDRPADREVMALSAMRRFAAAMASFLDAEAAIFDPAKPPPPKKRIAPRYPDWVAAIERGARPTVIFLGLGFLWLASANSSFQTLLLIATGLCVSLPAISPRAALTQGGKTLGLGFASMFLPVLALEMALPYVETFAAFALLVSSVFFVFFYICYDQMLRTYALGGAIFLATALQPSNAEQYNALGVFNAAVSLALLPLSIVAAFTIIIPESQAWLRRRLIAAATRLLARAARGRDDNPEEFLAQSLDAIGDYGGDLDLGETNNRHIIRRSRAITAAGLQLYELHRLRRLNHLPDALASLLPGVGAAIRLEAAATGTGSRDPGPQDHRAALEQARREGYRIASGDAAELAKSAALRFAIGVEFLQVLIEDRRLRPAG